MSDNTIHPAVEEYRLRKPLYDAFASRLELLLSDLLKKSDIKFHIVESRSKDIDSFREKITRPGKRYNKPLEDIKDLCGCRIIVYYQDDVDKVAKLIRSEFGVAEENLSRQPDVLEVDRFGYLSAHFIITLGKSRAELLEWQSHKDLCAEIQIRTVIQHAWSAVSHTIQYKQDANIPSRLQRRLHRIAGLFELADEEFVALRNQKQETLLQTRAKIENGSTVPIDVTSLQEFVSSWDGLSKLRSQAIAAGFLIDGPTSDFIPEIYDLSIINGFGDLDTLKNGLSKSSESYFRELIRINCERDEPEGWHVSLPFLILLKLIFLSYKRVDAKFLISRGWSPGIADIVLRAAANASTAV